MNLNGTGRREACAAAALPLLAVMVLSPGLAQRRQEAPKGPWMDASLPPDQRADMVIGQMTLDEKISLVHGPGGFEAAGAESNGGAGIILGIPRLGLPTVQLADSAVG